LDKGAAIKIGRVTFLHLLCKYNIDLVQDYIDKCDVFSLDDEDFNPLDRLLFSENKC